MTRSSLLLLLTLALPVAAAPPAKPAAKPSPQAAAKPAAPAAATPAMQPAGLPAVKPQPYHLILEANPAAPFPFLSKFGKTTLDVYPAGVRAETLWLNAFSRNGAPALTVENPLGRMYTDVPVAQLPPIVAKLASYKDDFGVNARLEPPVAGRLENLEAMRTRIVYGPTAWIDVWTTNALPDNPALRSIVTELTRGISPATAALVRNIPGMPLQVVMNFSHHPLVTVLKFRSLTRDAGGESDALKVGKLYVKAPLLDAVWK